RASDSAQLGGAHPGPHGAQQHPRAAAGDARRRRAGLPAQIRQLLAHAHRRSALLCPDPSPGALPPGRAIGALRENEPRATSVGIDVTHYLVLATVVSAAMAGAAGVLYAHYVRIVDPDVFLFIYTVTMVIMVISGGKGTQAGPIVGGLIFGLLPDLLRAAAIKPEIQWVIYGVLMILIVH